MKPVIFLLSVATLFVLGLNHCAGMPIDEEAEAKEGMLSVFQYFTDYGIIKEDPEQTKIRGQKSFPELRDEALTVMKRFNASNEAADLEIQARNPELKASVQKAIKMLEDQRDGRQTETDTDDDDADSAEPETQDDDTPVAVAANEAEAAPVAATPASVQA